MPKVYQNVKINGKEYNHKDAVIILNLADALHTDVENAQKLFSQYGKNYLYSNCAFAVHNTPENRKRLITLYRFCVYVTKYGNVVYYSKYKTRKIRIASDKMREISQISGAMVRVFSQIISATQMVYNGCDIRNAHKQAQAFATPKRGRCYDFIGSKAPYIRRQVARNADTFNTQLDNLRRGWNQKRAIAE